jgi:hypothetical protein
MTYTISFNAPWPLLGIEAGHFLALNTSVGYPFHMLACRPLPVRHDLVLGALTEGVAELVNPRFCPSDLAAAIGWPHPVPPGQPAGPTTLQPRHHLRRLK